VHGQEIFIDRDKFVFVDKPEAGGVFVGDSLPEIQGA
jgi:hypothetical protein